MQKDSPTNNNPEPIVYKVKDIAKILGCGINRAYNIVNRPTFPKIKIGNRMYIPKEEFEKWLKTYTYREFQI